MDPAFESFTISNWSEWIYNCAFGLPTSPPLPSSEPEIHIGLTDLYHALTPGARARFAHATVRVFESIQPDPTNCEALFVLCQLLSVTSSLSRDIIRQRLASRSFEGSEFANHDLVDLLIQAAAEQTVDDELVELLERIGIGSSSRRRLLTCIRAVSKRGDSTFTRFLPSLLSVLKTEADTRAVSDQLNQCFRRAGYKHFFLWLFEDYPGLPVFDADCMDLFEKGLATGPLRWPEPNGILDPYLDPYYVLASGWVNAGRRKFTARDLFMLANQLRLVSELHVKAVLARVRDRWVKIGSFHTRWRVFRPSRYSPLSAGWSEANEVFEIQTEEMDASTFTVALNNREEKLLLAVGKDFTSSQLVM